MPMEKVEKLVKLGDQIQFSKIKRKKRQEYLKRICEQFRKDVHKHLEDEMFSAENSEIESGMLNASGILKNFGFGVEQVETDGKITIDTKFVIDLK